MGTSRMKTGLSKTLGTFLVFIIHFGECPFAHNHNCRGSNPHTLAVHMPNIMNYYRNPQVFQKNTEHIPRKEAHVEYGLSVDFPSPMVFHTFSCHSICHSSPGCGCSLALGSALAGLGDRLHRATQATTIVPTGYNWYIVVQLTSGVKYTI